MSLKEEIYKNAPMAELNSNDGSARLRIYTYSYEFPNATNRDDVDWYLNFISLFINGTKIEINEPIIEARRLKVLKDELLTFMQNKVKSVVFGFTEPELTFTLTRKKDKSITVIGNITDFKLNKSTAHTQFEFKTDHYLLEKFYEGIEQILTEYPPRYYSNEFNL